MYFITTKSTKILSPCLRLLAMFLLAASSTVFAADKIHTNSLPKGVTIPEQKNDYAFLEGERKSHDGDMLASETQKDRTFYCEKNTPDDKWWTTVVPYDKSRFSSRGSDKDQPWHSHLWNLKSTGLNEGVYDAWARIMVSPGGSCELGVTTGKNIPTDIIKTDKNNIFWIQVGSVEVSTQTTELKLYMRTKKSAIRLDTLLLVKAAPETASAGFKRKDITAPQWQKESGLVFTSNSAVVGYAAKNPNLIKSVEVAVSTPEAVNANWKSLTAQKEGEWHIPLPTTGWYDIKIKAQQTNGEIITDGVTVAVVGEPITEDLRMQSVFGLWNVHGDSALVKLAGARWNRRMTSFRDVTQAQVKETTSECAHSYTIRDGLEYIGVFSFGMPLWSMKVPDNYKRHGFGNPFFPAKNWGEISDIVKTFVCNNPMPQIMEMYNEPLAHWKGSKRELVEYAAAVRAGLKKADNKFMLAGPCLYSIRIGDLEALAKEGLFDNLDAISMHAYVNGTAPETEFYNKIIELNQLLKKYKQQNKPIYLTEFGWTSSDGTWQPAVDLNTQTSYIPRSLALAWSQGIDSLIFFVLKFNTSNKGEAAFSLFDHEYRPKPGYVSFATVSKFFAAVKPLGHFNLTPDVHMVAGVQGENLKLAIWSSGKATKIKLPFSASMGLDTFGRTIDITGSNFTCTQNPIYLEVPISEAATLSSSAAIELPISAVLPQGIFWPLENMSSDIAFLSPGRYSGLRKNKNNWEVIPIDLVTPLTIKKTEIIWPLNKKQPQIQVTLKSNIANATQTPHVWLNTNQPKKLSIPAGSIRQVVFNTDNFAPAKVMHSEINISDKNSNTISTKLDWSALAAYSVNKNNQWTDFTDWAPFGVSGDGGLCKGALKLEYSEKEFIVQVRVTDDEHFQKNTNASPDRLWAADSLQIAFDMDATKPWVAGVVGSGLSGHRIFEYSVSAESVGKAVVFRERSYTEGITPNIIATDINAQMTRKDNETVYTISFPWKSLGVDKPLNAGDVIGFALAVNDVDPSRKAKRHGLRIFKGITESKDAKLYGRVWLR